jgi:hypothetical protein
MAVERGIEGMCLDSEGNIVGVRGLEEERRGPVIYVISAIRHDYWRRIRRRRTCRCAARSAMRA